MPAGPITRHDAPGGVRIYRIPVSAFPHLVANVFVVVAGDYAALVDAGSGLGESDADLRAGMDALRAEWGERLGWADLRRIVITHAHIDHYGGLGFVREQTGAPIAVHALDRRVLTNHEERLVLASRAVSSFLRRAGVDAPRRAELMQMYGWSKGLFSSLDVAAVLEDGDTLDDVFSIHHAPGHCPGQVCLQIGDVLITADHVLPQTSLFLAPESITPATGVEHYLQALRKVGRIPGIRLALGGHEGPIDDFYAAVARLEESQHQRIDRVREACAEPRTIAELTRMLYPAASGYDVLLALQKAGAYVEYLDSRGELAIANIDEVAGDEDAPPRYRRV